MDQIRTGALIRLLRETQNLTQLRLAEQIGVSDKAVSKWERGRGAPDLSLLPRLAEALHVDTDALLRGDLEENTMTNGNLNKVKFYVCPTCGNLLLSTDAALVACCGRPLEPLTPQTPDEAHDLRITLSDGEWYVSSPHEMRRDHFLSFFAFRTDDALVVKKRYPEGDAEARLPFFAHGTLLWFCSRDGLFARKI